MNAPVDISALSPLHAGQDRSPATSTASYPGPSSSPSPLGSIDSSSMDSPADHALLQPHLQAEYSQDQQLSILSAIPSSSTVPSTSFSYRQISPNTHPPMPTSSDVAGLSSAEAMDAWIRDIQQLQQLHHYQRHQLLSSNLLDSTQGSIETLYNDPVAAYQIHSSERSLSPSCATTPSDGSKDVFRSSSAEEDMAMDSGSDDHTGSGPYSQKPSTSDPGKKMTTKEFKQLRNKLCSRNFRMRRKEYITTLENQVKEARKETTDVQRRLIQSELTCQLLRQQLETSRLSQSLLSALRVSPENATLLTCLLNPNTESLPATGTTAAPVSPTNTADSTIIDSAAQSISQTQQSTPFLITEAVSSDISDSNISLLQASAHESVLTIPSPSNTASTPYQPFIFDENWGLYINRAEIPEYILDHRKESSERASCQYPLDQYGTDKQEPGLYERIHKELVVEDALLAQTVMYRTMVYLVWSLLEAATMSKPKFDNVCRITNAPPRIQMEDHGQQQNTRNKSRIRKFLPSLRSSRYPPESRNDPSLAPRKADTIEATREVGEGVIATTSDSHRMNYFAIYYDRMRMKLWMRPNQSCEEKRRIQAERKMKERASSNPVNPVQTLVKLVA